MSCLYCWDGFSSKIQQENAKHGRFEKHGVVIDNIATRTDTTALTASMWQWMDQNHHQLARFNILGGEPFYQKQFEQCLEFFEHHPSPNLEFTVVSNLMISSDKLQTIIERIRNLLKTRKIKRFDLTASIDCFGAEQEYVRHGLDLEQWKTNFEFLVKQKWIVLNINQTLSGLTIKTVPEMLSYVNQVKGNRPVGHYFSTTVMTHEFMHPDIFGPGFFDYDFAKILECMSESNSQKYMQGIQMQINAESRNQTKINQLAIFLDEMDRRRNTNWREVFPWLGKELTHVV
jgi:organic radical activating enzyme